MPLNILPEIIWTVKRDWAFWMSTILLLVYGTGVGLTDIRLTTPSSGRVIRRICNLIHGRREQINIMNYIVFLKIKLQYDKLTTY